MNKQLDPQKMPKHVAIIMDGNGRWANKRGKPRIFGHRSAVKAVLSAVEFATKNNIEVLTLYAFSSENWNRPDDEINALMKLFSLMLQKQLKNLQKNNVKLKVIGDITKLNHFLQNRVIRVEKITENNKGLLLNIAVNYGGRWEIVDAVNQILQDNQYYKQQISEQIFSSYLNTTNQPDVDLVIRTSGEKRISNFLLWQIAYAELYFTDILWPDFNEQEFTNAILNYQSRNRRFGKI